MTRDERPTASVRHKKTKQYVRKTKRTATSEDLPVASPSDDLPIAFLSEDDVEEGNVDAVSAAPFINDHVGSSTSVASEKDDGGPVNKSVLTSFKYHIASAIWN